MARSLKPSTSVFTTGAMSPPRGRLAKSEDIWGCHNWEGYYWHLAGRGQGCKQDGPPAENDQAQHQEHRGSWHKGPGGKDRDPETGDEAR